MFMITIPPEPPAAVPMIVAQAEPAQHGSSIDYVVRDCQDVEHASNRQEVNGGNVNVLGPQYDLARLLKLKDDALDALVRLETRPEHGQLRRIAYYKYDDTKGKGERAISRIYMLPDGSLPDVPPDTSTVKYVKVSGEKYRYITTPGYYGKDRAAFSVEYNGKRYHIDLEIRVHNFVPQASEGISCPPPRLIKVIPKQSRTDSENTIVGAGGAGSLD